MRASALRLGRRRRRRVRPWGDRPLPRVAQLLLELRLGGVDLTAVLALCLAVDEVTGLVDALGALFLVALQHPLELVEHGHPGPPSRCSSPSSIRAAPDSRIR